MKKSLMALLFGALLVLGACGGGDKADKPADDGAVTVVDGEAVYKQSCVSCHGGNLEGKSGPALDTIGATLSEAEIKDVVMNGVGGMPAILKGKDADADAVAKWLADKK
ncbi:cytochrome c551 [Sporosarcina sp. CAU 1771]